jgi:hypothetical protein
MINLPLRKTIAGLTASALLEKAQIVETMSGDFYVRVGDLNLDVTEEYELCVSYYDGTGLGIMTLTREDQDKLTSLLAETETRYEAAAAL